MSIAPVNMYFFRPSRAAIYSSPAPPPPLTKKTCFIQSGCRVFEHAYRCVRLLSPTTSLDQSRVVIAAHRPSSYSLHTVETPPVAGSLE